jgi:putative tricarboxylic transport membrane protein
MSSRHGIIAAALVLAAVSSPVHAQAFTPSKPIEFVTHTGPGGGGDVMARQIAAGMEKEKLLPVRMQIANKTGGGGATGMAYMAEKRGSPIPSRCSPGSGTRSRSCARKPRSR